MSELSCIILEACLAETCEKKVLRRWVFTRMLAVSPGLGSDSQSDKGMTKNHQPLNRTLLRIPSTKTLLGCSQQVQCKTNPSPAFCKGFCSSTHLVVVALISLLLLREGLKMKGGSEIEVEHSASLVPSSRRPTDASANHRLSVHTTPVLRFSHHAAPAAAAAPP